MEHCTCKNCRQRDKIVAKIAALPAAAMSDGQLRRLANPRMQAHTGEAR